MFFKMIVSVVVLFSSLYSFGQGTSEEELRAVVIVARHGVRTPIENETRSGVFNAQPWPKWSTPPGMLTPHGVDALKRMGQFYKQRYAALINGCDRAVVESTNTPRTIGSAKSVMSALLPSCDIKVAADLTSDPPSINKTKLANAIYGRMGNNPEWLTRAFGRPLAEMHDVLTRCDGCKQVPDFRVVMLGPEAPLQSMMMQSQGSKPGAFIPRDPRKENAAALGADFAENFLLEYAEGMAMDQVGWGRVDRAKLDDLMEMNTQYHDFILRTPYYAQQAAGPMARKIVTFLEEGVKTPRLAYFSAHDANLTWLGGLLRMDWMVSDGTFNATPPGSALVFELHQNSRTNTATVQVLFIAQTLEQIRNLTPLTGEEKPSISPVYVPGCSGPEPEYACPLNEFAKVVEAALH